MNEIKQTKRPVRFYGILLNTGDVANSIRITRHKLLNAGYEPFATHTESRMFGKVDEEWLRRIDPNKLFPRFHIIKEKDEWLIHYDYFKGGKKITKKTKSPQMLNEIKRLKNITKHK